MKRAVQAVQRLNALGRIQFAGQQRLEIDTGNFASR